MYIGVDVNTLNGTATLTGVKDGAVDNLLCNVFKVRIGAHVRRIVTAKFKVDIHEAAGGALPEHTTSLGRADKADQLNFRKLHNALQGLWVTRLDNLQHILRKPGLVEDLGNTLSDERSLGGRLEDEGVSGKKGREQRVDNNEVGELFLVRSKTWKRMSTYILTFQAKTINVGPKGSFSIHRRYPSSA